MFTKRRSKNYDSPAEGELQGNYTVVSDLDIVNSNNTVNCDVPKDLPLTSSSSSCALVTATEIPSKPNRQSLPVDVRSTKEKRCSLKKRLSFRLFDSKGKKKHQCSKEHIDIEVTAELGRKKDNNISEDSLDANKSKVEEKDTVVCNRNSSLLEEILAETGPLNFTVLETKDDL